MDGWQKLTDVFSSNERKKYLKVGGGGRGNEKGESVEESEYKKTC